MMYFKTLKQLIILSVFTTGLTTIQSQTISGKVTYKYKEKLPDLNIEDEAEKAALMDILKADSEKTYQLEFSGNTSLYQEVIPPNISNNNKPTSFYKHGEQDGILYIDAKQRTFTNKHEFMGKLFLITDELPQYHWKLINETKTIGKYTCYKALFKKTIPQKASNKDSKKKVINYIANDSSKTTKTEKVITAWYTPQLPINLGPQTYHGLPGLILQLNYDDITLACEKIVIDNKERKIKKPKQGEVVSQKEFDSISDVKMKEFRSRYRPAKN